MQRPNDTGINFNILTGPHGLTTIEQHGTFTTPNPDQFTSEWREIKIDKLSLAEWRISPLIGTCQAGRQTSGVVLVMVTEGLLHCTTRTGAIEGTPDSILLLAAAENVRFEIPTATRMLRIETASHTPRPLGTVSLGRTPATRLTSILASLTEVMLDPALGGPHSPAARTIYALTTAVLENTAPAPSTDNGRRQIIAYIEAHLTETQLGPQSIASAFGVSLRWVHHVFSRDGVSIARYIRHRRLDLVATELRRNGQAATVAHLATQYGFPTPNQLSRGFKARYGVPITEYTTHASPRHTCA